MDISGLQFCPPRVIIEATVHDTEQKHQEACAESHPKPTVKLFDASTPPPTLFHHHDILFLALALPPSLPPQSCTGRGCEFVERVRGGCWVLYARHMT